MSDLPLTWNPSNKGQPSVPIPNYDITYGIMVPRERESGDDMATIRGPVKDLSEMLRITPPDDAILVRFGEDGSDRPLYSWDGTQWVLN